MYLCQEPDPNQLELFNAALPFDGKLDSENRWVRLAHTLDWREWERSYAKLFAAEGRPGLRARFVLGTLILKHQHQTSDEEILQIILESPYLQYFIGLPRFTTTMPFEASSLSRVRERLGDKTFAAFEQTLINTLVAQQLIRAKGLLVDATVYESEITYPTDCGLLEKARVFCVKQIERLREVVPEKVRTYCRVAPPCGVSQLHEEEAQNEKRNSSHAEIRVAIPAAQYRSSQGLAREGEGLGAHDGRGSLDKVRDREENL